MESLFNVALGDMWSTWAQTVPAHGTQLKNVNNTQSSIVLGHDVKIEKDCVVVTINIPGVKPEDVDVSTSVGSDKQKRIFVSGKFNLSKKEFSQSFRIDDVYDISNTLCEIKFGQLIITIPKLVTRTETKKIPIKF